MDFKFWQNYLSQTSLLKMQSGGKKKIGNEQKFWGLDYIKAKQTE